MKYAYLVFMEPFGVKGPTQGKTLLGVHTSLKSAGEHFEGILADRQGRREYDHFEWHDHEAAYPDWCNRRIRTVTIMNKQPGPDTWYPDWYATIEHIIIEQWKVSRPKKKGKRRCRR